MADFRTITKYLVVKSTGDMRIVARATSVADDEIAVPLVVRIPNAWGLTDKSQTISIDIPAPPKVEKQKLRRIQESVPA